MGISYIIKNPMVMECSEMNQTIRSPRDEYFARTSHTNVIVQIYYIIKLVLPIYDLKKYIQLALFCLCIGVHTVCLTFFLF